MIEKRKAKLTNQAKKTKKYSDFLNIPFEIEKDLGSMVKVRNPNDLSHRVLIPIEDIELLPNSELVMLNKRLTERGISGLKDIEHLINDVGLEITIPGNRKLTLRHDGVWKIE